MLFTTFWYASICWNLVHQVHSNAHNSRTHIKTMGHCCTKLYVRNEKHCASYWPRVVSYSWGIESKGGFSSMDGGPFDTNLLVPKVDEGWAAEKESIRQKHSILFVLRTIWNRIRRPSEGWWSSWRLWASMLSRRVHPTFSSTHGDPSR